jgi:hypothetical protein
MSKNTQFWMLRTIIDSQDEQALKQFLSENTDLDLNNVTFSGMSALWYALYPPKNKKISEEIISVLLETKKIQTRSQLHHMLLPREIISPKLKKIIEKAERLEDEALEDGSIKTQNISLQNIAENKQNTHLQFIVQKTDESVSKLYKRYVTENSPLVWDNTIEQFINTLVDKQKLSLEAVSSLNNAIERIKADDTVRQYTIMQGISVELNLQQTVALIWRSLNDQDESAFVKGAGMEAEDQTNRKLWFINNLIQSQNEYGQNSKACWMGTRNLIVNALNQIHKDVSVSVDLPLSKELVRYNYQAFCNNALQNLMNNDIELFYKYIYHSPLKGTTYGALEDDTVDEDVKKFIEQTHLEFKKSILESNTNNLKKVKEETLNQWMKELIDPSATEELVLDSNRFVELSQLETLIFYCQPGNSLHQNCLLAYEETLLISILRDTTPLNEKLILLQKKLNESLSVTTLLRELNQCPLIKLYFDSLDKKQTTDKVKTYWKLFIDDLLLHKKVNYEATFLRVLQLECNTLCPENKDWLNSLPAEEQTRFFTEYLEKNQTLSKEKLTDFIAQWAFKNNQLSHLVFSEKKVFEDTDFRGINLSSLNLENVTFKNCDLRLTNIDKNKTIKGSNILEDNVFEESIYLAAFMSQNKELIKYLLKQKPSIEALDEFSLIKFNKPLSHLLAQKNFHEELSLLLDYNSTDEFINHKWYGSALHTAASYDNIESVNAILNHNKSANIINGDASKHSALHVAIYNNKMDIVKTILQHNSTNEIINNISNGKTCLHHALGEENSNKAAEIILQYNHSEEVINAVDKSGNTTLYYASYREGFKEGKTILEYNHSHEFITTCGNNGLSALDAAIFPTNSDAIENILMYDHSYELLFIPRYSEYVDKFTAYKHGLISGDERSIKALDKAAYLFFEEPFNYKHKELKALLDPLENKIRNLQSRNEIIASREAIHLFISVYQAGETYLDNPYEPTVGGASLNFQYTCKEAIDKARPTLEQYRGWKQYFYNFGLCIAGFGIGYVAAVIINRALFSKNFLFFQTDSADKVDAIEKNLSDITKSKK